MQLLGRRGGGLERSDTSMDEYGNAVGNGDDDDASLLDLPMPSSSDLIGGAAERDGRGNAGGRRLPGREVRRVWHNRHHGRRRHDRRLMMDSSARPRRIDRRNTTCVASFIDSL